MRSKPAITACPLIFVDTETGGLDPAKNEVLEVAWIKTSPDAQTVLQERCYKLRPQFPERIEPEAARINGYDPAIWNRHAVGPTPVWAEFCEHGRDSVFVAHNAAFDWGFVKAALTNSKLRWPGRYHIVDTVALAWPLLAGGRMGDAKLASLVEHFRLRQEKAHTALSDARDCLEIYRRLIALWNHVLDNAEFGEPLTSVLKEAS